MKLREQAVLVTDGHDGSVVAELVEVDRLVFAVLLAPNHAADAEAVVHAVNLIGNHTIRQGKGRCIQNSNTTRGDTATNKLTIRMLCAPFSIFLYLIKENVFLLT